MEKMRHRRFGAITRANEIPFEPFAQILNEFIDYRWLDLNQENTLAGELESLAAANVAASDHVIHTNHVGASFGQFPTVLFVPARRNLRLFRAHYVTHGIGVFL